ncbi:MAG: hypothetical protein ACE37F_19155 [Nannocystaceae bacterium]|nr:hypothetical protein [bacterium]
MIALLLAARLCTAPEPLPPDPRSVAREVAALLEEGKINEAFAAIEAANAAAPDARYLFMRAALEEQLGRCSVAVPLYREFHAISDDENDRAEAQAGLERCGADPQPPSEPDTTKPDEPPPPVVEPRPVEAPEPEPRRWQRDRLGWALLGSGTAVTIGGGVVFGLGASAARDTRAATLQSAHADSTQRATRMQPAGIALVAVGAAIWVGGAVRMAVVSRRNPPRSAHLRPSEGFSIFF